MNGMVLIRVGRKDTPHPTFYVNKERGKAGTELPDDPTKPFSTFFVVVTLVWIDHRATMGTPWPSKEKHSPNWCDTKPSLSSSSCREPSSTEAWPTCASSEIVFESKTTVLRDSAMGPLDEDFKFFMRHVPQCLTPADIRNHFEVCTASCRVSVWWVVDGGFQHMTCFIRDPASLYSCVYVSHNQPLPFDRLLLFIPISTPTTELWTCHVCETLS
eukprot:scaffold4869_cov183-Amphora_coffeaeformis.AAC.14